MTKHLEGSTKTLPIRMEYSSFIRKQHFQTELIMELKYFSSLRHVQNLYQSET